MTERSAGLPSQKQVIELLDGEFARAGYEIEDVVDRHRGPPAPHHRDRRRRRPPGSRLDRGAVPVRVRCCWIASTPPPYVLEVTSPGVDRPLTTEKHYRRARGRKVELTLSDGSQLTGRLGEIRRRHRATGGARGREGQLLGPRTACSTASPKPLSRLSFRRQTSVSWSWPANLGRRLQREHRHGGIARHRGRQGHLGRRGRRHHQVGAADRLPAHRGPRGRRPHRDRPQDRRRQGDGARDRRRRQRHQRMGRHPRGFRPDRGDHRTPGDPAAAARRREREELRRVLRPRGRHRRRRHPARRARQRPRPGRRPDGQRDQGIRGRHPGGRAGPR